MTASPEEYNAHGFTDEQIADMPLHAVTETLGHDGLVRRFELEIANFTEEEQAQLQKAFNLAMDLHSEDKRFRDSSTNHILRVAIRIMHHYEVSDVNLITASLMHDSIEDHLYEITGGARSTRQDGLRVIESEFNEDVASLVSSVTNPEYDKKRDKAVQYHEHVRSILLDDDPRVRILKASDFTDNALGIIYAPTGGISYLVGRYLPLVPAFEKAIMKPDTPLSMSAKAHILKQLEETRRRLEILKKQPVIHPPAR